jgi:hypothetical protein
MCLPDTKLPILPCLGIRIPRKDSLLVDQIPDVQWVILIILDSNLTSFDAWQLDRHWDEIMFQSDSWRTSPTFADEHAVSLSLRAKRRWVGPHYFEPTDEHWPYQVRTDKSRR